MKMIYAIVRPEKVYEVNKALADAGYGTDRRIRQLRRWTNLCPAGRGVLYDFITE